MPFINQGITILTISHTDQAFSLFQAFSPLRIEVWISIMISIVVVATATTCLSRWSPFDYYGKAIDKLRRLENDKKIEKISVEDFRVLQMEKENEIESFSFGNNLWYTLSSFLSQDPARTPRSISARLITAIWWFASVVFTATYTANLTAFLTVNSLQTCKLNSNAANNHIICNITTSICILNISTFAIMLILIQFYVSH